MPFFEPINMSGLKENVLVTQTLEVCLTLGA